MVAAASGDCPASSSHRGVTRFLGRCCRRETGRSHHGTSLASAPFPDSPVHSDTVAALVHRHRLGHGDDRALVDRRPPTQMGSFWCLIQTFYFKSSEPDLLSVKIKSDVGNVEG
ncbi:unnamed protein product [Tetraodon nigroviridis]|uniref:Chromosome undetermined SCAF6085, whole genome shotgun sequence n=1 Tax=Tetraodon nigroviridis TaxID=99883 RepID=Q4TDR5_TETNG|nr:unnamed protein product [Tetraodon nigroviridis]